MMTTALCSAVCGAAAEARCSLSVAVPAVGSGSDPRRRERHMGTDDVGGRDFKFGVTGVLLMVTVAILFAILS